MTTPAFTTLPAADELLRCLTAVDNSNHVVEKFYPLLLAKAGQEQTGTGFVLALHLAIADYTSGMPPVTFTVLQQRAEQFVRAVIDDARVLDEALATLRDLGLTA